jgi:hypothetical protein
VPIRGVISRQANDLTPLIDEAAHDFAIPARALTALLITESSLNEQASRFGVWPDVSFGLGQQTVRYAPVGDQSPRPDNIDFVRRFYFVARNAIREAAHQLAAYWARFRELPDEWRYYEAASRYNGGGNMAFKDNPNRANIARGWKESAQYLVQEVPMAEFQAGFLELANVLGRDVVGDPLADEYVSGPTTRQPTTRGEMIWTDGGPALFLPAV